jgi:hypothetical protein
MAGFKVDFFKGIRPRISAFKLGPGEAETALNVKLGSGDLEPIPDKTTLQACVRSSVRSIYKYHDDGGDLWFEWTDRVQVAQGPIKNDSYNRIYYTGDSAGDGKPKFTTNTLADGGGGGPYPEDWLYMGVPAPTGAPTVSVVQLPEDVQPASRLAKNMRTLTFEIDQVAYTEHPGTGTDNQTWRLNASATGSIAFDVQLGTAFRVTEVINANRLKLESATEPGIAMRTENSDKTTVNDWHPMDEQGSTKTADFIGWRVPPGMEATIVGHKLGVGDVIVVTANNYPPQFFAAATTDFYEQSWDADTNYYVDGATEVEVRDAAIGANSGGTAYFTVSGSFYYDVDRASSDVSELEDRTYVYTYVNSFGEEGPPSPPSEVTPQLDGRDVTISDMVLPPTMGYTIDKMRLYRSNSTEAGTEYQFVKEFDLSRTTTDSVLSEDLGETIPSTTWDAPPSDMGGIVDMPNGMMVGFSGKTLHFCEPYFPHAWPPEYDRAIAYEIVGLATFGNSVAVMTTGWPYIITGAHPRNANVRPIQVNQPCINAASIATDDNSAYYASNEGICQINETGVRVVTEQFVDKEDWENYSPSTMVSAFYEGRYYGFYDFTGGTPDVVITAEISGTVTNAEEGDIVDGGKTLIITLYNDSWVAAGTAFNNQRAAIIAGLDCTTDQTNGWNAIMRDSIIQVTDVVRTSDSVVTITLPSASLYSIDSEEKVVVTVPAAALTISNSAVISGSVFRIQPDAPSATVTMSGTLDGAAEASVVSGGLTIILTLTNDTWQTTLTTDMKQAIIDGLNATTNELNGWNDTVPQEISTSSVVRTSDSVVTITLPAVADYSVTENETIEALVPYQALVLQEDVDAGSSNSLGIIATGVPAAILSGTVVSGGVTENEIVAGSETLIITLTNDTWIAAGTGPIGTTAQSQALLDGILSNTTPPTNGWDNQVQPNLVPATHLARTSDTVATITLPAAGSYSIADDETIGVTIPNAVLTTSTEDLTASNTFGITAQFPVTCVLGGTATSSITESDIVTGGKTITLTLSNDTWVASGATFDAQRQNIIDGLAAATSPTNGWDNELIGTGGSGSLDVTDVVRTSDTLVTITLPADAQYDISADETITATIPASALVISASSVVASPTFTIGYEAPVTAAITGTLHNSSSSTVKVGGLTVIITLTNDTWVAAGAAFNAIRQDIIDGLDAATSPDNGWNNELRDVMDVTTVVRTSSTVVTITTPATSTYDINGDETITVTVPASALTTSASPVTGDSTITISASDASTSKFLVAWSQGNGANGKIEESYFDPAYYYQHSNISGDTQGTALSLGYSSGAGLWIANVGDWGSPFDGKLMTSSDDGATWTERTAAFEPKYSSETPACYDDFGAIISGDNGTLSSQGKAAQWSADGITWSNCTTGMEANLTGSGWRYANGHWFGYDGTYLYHKSLFLDTASGTVLGFIKNDISGANTPASSTWGAEFASNMDYSNDGGTELGEGYLINFGSISGNTRLEYMTQGGSSLTLAADTLPSNTRNYPEFMAFDGSTKWVAINHQCQAWTIDTTGGTLSVIDPADWTASAGYVFGSGSELLYNLFYDKGSDGTNGVGWVAVTETGSSSATTTKVYTSTDGTTWTLQKSFTDASGAYHDVLPGAGPRYPITPAQRT